VGREKEEKVKKERKERSLSLWVERKKRR